MLGVNVKQRCSKGVARLTTSLGMGDAGRGQEGERELHAVRQGSQVMEWTSRYINAKPGSLERGKTTVTGIGRPKAPMATVRVHDY